METPLQTTLVSECLMDKVYIKKWDDYDPLPCFKCSYLVAEAKEKTATESEAVWKISIKARQYRVHLMKNRWLIFKKREILKCLWFFEAYIGSGL